MGEILNFDTIHDYNSFLGIETLHPLVSSIDFSTVTKEFHHIRKRYGFYFIFLKDVKCGDLIYGRHTYDYQEGTLVLLVPDRWQGKMIRAKLSKCRVGGFVFIPICFGARCWGKR